MKPTDTDVLCHLIATAQMNPDDAPIKVLQFYEEIVLEDPEIADEDFVNAYWSMRSTK